MQIIFTDELSKTPFEQDVWNILCECDEDFVPPLSARENSSQKNLNDIKSVEKLLPYTYFDSMKKQNFILVLDNNCVIAFMTFIHQYFCEELEHIGMSNYITTICVRKLYRNNGLLKQMYAYMEENIPAQYKLPYMSTRTWSTNTYHLIALDRLGFHISTRLKNHRGPDIDTIYFYKTLSLKDV